MKEILFVIGSLDRGGAERVIATLANDFCKDYKVTIITMLSDKAEYEIDDSINIINLSKRDRNRIFKVPRWFLELSRIFKRLDRKNSVIVSFIARINILVILANIFKNIPLIVSERNDPKNDGRGLGVTVLSSLLYRLSDKIVFQTQYAKNLFSKAVQRKGIIIYNPILVEYRKNNEDERKVFVTAGRLSEQKNHLLLIEAFKQVSEIYPEFLLHIYGEGPLRKMLKDKINALKIQGKVELRGNSADLHKLIKYASIFVMTSNYEGQSNALLEAMAMGLPCITTNIPGINELVNSDNAVLFDLGNKQQLVDAMIALIENPDKRKKLGKSAEEIVSLVSKENIINQWRALLLDVETEQQ